MNIFIRILFLIGLSIGASSAFDLKHREHLEIFTKYRHPLEPNYLAWKDAKLYLQKTFQEFGLQLHTQQFSTKIPNTKNALVEVIGQNFIAESSTETNAPVVALATYYDSTFQRNPLMENGASVATLLETARNFQSLKMDNKIFQNVTVLFVALDINSKNYIPSGPGPDGASLFVKEWLTQNLGSRKFLGAIILDSVSSYNTDPNSQILIDGFKEAFPSAYKTISDTQFRGNFLGALSRKDNASQILVNQIQRRFSTEFEPFTLEPMILADGVKISNAIKNMFLKRSPHISFWTNEPPLPALLLTDMGITRKDFDSEKCDINCSLDIFWNKERQNFVYLTTSSLIQILLDYQTLREAEPESPIVIPEVPEPELPNKTPKLESKFYLVFAGFLVLKCFAAFE